VQRTLILLKPDTLQRRLAGQILTRFEQKGLNLIALKMISVSKELAARHYADHVEKGWYPTLESFITSSPVIAAILEGREAIGVVRRMVGPTDGLEADPGTIRGDFSTSGQKNLVHASDNEASARREIDVFFDASEIHSHEPALRPWLVAVDED